MLRPRTCFLRLALASVLAVFLMATRIAAGENWPQFRGPSGTGHTDEKNLPVEWNADSITWKANLKGRGQSSPVVWGQRVFVTTATGDAGGVDRWVVCLDLKSGKQLWEVKASTTPGESLHKLNTWASPTCATDGERVMAFFGDGGLHCFSVEGEKLWSRDLGKFSGGWGTGASPIILGDLVIQNCDAEGAAYLLAVNKNTGEDVWRTPRRDTPTGGWSTPLPVDVDGRQELVLNGEFGVQGYDPTSGKDLWSCKSFNGRGTPMPVPAFGRLLVVNGKPGDMYAVRPGGQGDVTKTHMDWHARRTGGRDLGSPIVVGQWCLVVSMKGVGTLYHARDGKTAWTERLDGNFTSSPIATDKLVYVQSEEGQTLVIKPGAKFEIVARNKLGNPADEIFRASPAAVNGQLLLRSDRAVYCIGRPTAEAG